jgi:hypothetical protein
VRDEDAVFGLVEYQRNRMEQLARAVPGEFIAPRLKTRLEMLCELRAHGAVGTVGCHDQVGIERRRISDALFEFDLDARLQTGALQDPEHVDPGCAREMIAVNLHMRTAMHDIHVIAALVVGREILEELRIRVAQEIQPDIGEHHAPAIGRIGRILLVNVDVECRVILLGEKREIESARSTTNHGDPHDWFLCSRVN